MATLHIARDVTIALLAATVCLSRSAAGADENPLDLLVGRWDVRVKTLQPVKGEITYRETYDWVLDRRFLRGRTEQKPDGTEDIVYGTHDAQLNGYPFWIFSSTGTYVSLPPAVWDARKRTLEWKSPPNSEIYYNTLVVYPDDRTRRWTLIVKDWTGKVLLQQEGSAVRRDK